MSPMNFNRVPFFRSLLDDGSSRAPIALAVQFYTDGDEPTK
jgi:hypothetical protein